MKLKNRNIQIACDGGAATGKSTGAKMIAKKSPLTIRGIKSTLLYTRDNSVKESLSQIKMHNSAFLYSSDLMEAMSATMMKKEPNFRDK